MIKTYKFFGVLFAILFFVFFGFGSYTVVDSAFAGDYVTSYSNVLDDLGKDEEFNIDDYPVDVSDYSLEIVTIAESEDDELFIYTYQPCFTKNFRATSISMSVSSDNVAPKLYYLNFINKSGTLYKYKVSDFIVSSGNVRYYEIYSIFRRFDAEIDPSTDDPSQTTNEVSFRVAKKWSVSSSDNNYAIECRDVEVITVTDKFVGFVRYPDGFVWLGVDGACDSHFVAFSTDKPIDRLFEADVSYVKQSYHRDWAQTSGAVETFGTATESEVTLSYQDRAYYQGAGLFGYRYVWNRIESVSDFIANTENSSIYSNALLDVSAGTTITSEAKASLQGKQWVLRFAETSYHYESAGSGISAIAQTDSTLVGSVTILRLYFETDGVVYNLGVVDNKQTGSDKPINSGSHIDVDFKNPFDDTDPDDWWKYVIAAMIFVSSVLILVLIIKIINKIPKKTKTVVSYSRSKKKHKRGK